MKREKHHLIPHLVPRPNEWNLPGPAVLYDALTVLSAEFEQLSGALRVMRSVDQECHIRTYILLTCVIKRG